jgi:hypothetical protein
MRCGNNVPIIAVKMIIYTDITFESGTLRSRALLGKLTASNSGNSLPSMKP